jgi:hypothetical protein
VPPGGDAQRLEVRQPFRLDVPQKRQRQVNRLGVRDAPAARALRLGRPAMQRRGGGARRPEGEEEA